MVSISRIGKAGYTVLFNGDTCKIKNKNENVIGKIPVGQNRLYRVEHEQVGAAILEDNGILALHRRLGHISGDTIRTLVCNNVVSGLQLIDDKRPHLLQPEGPMAPTTRCHQSSRLLQQRCLVPPRSLPLLSASFRPAVCLDVALLLAVVAFDVALVPPLLGLGSKSLILGLLVNVLAEHALVVVVTDVFDDSGRVDALAGLIGIRGDCADAHLVTRWQGLETRAMCLSIAGPKRFPSSL